MKLAETNKEIRVELKTLSQRSNGLSIIYYNLLEYLGSDQKEFIKQHVKEYIQNDFLEEQIRNFYSQNKDAIFLRRGLDREIIELLKELCG